MFFLPTFYLPFSLSVSNFVTWVPLGICGLFTKGESTHGRVRTSFRLLYIEILSILGHIIKCGTINLGS